jgi:hypothetical protein
LIVDHLDRPADPPVSAETLAIQVITDSSVMHPDTGGDLAIGQPLTVKLVDLSHLLGWSFNSHHGKTSSIVDG